MRQLYGKAVIDAAGVQEFLQADELAQVLDSLRTINTAIAALHALGVLDQPTREEIQTLLEGLQASPNARAADVLNDLLDAAQAAHPVGEEPHTLLTQTPNTERQLDQSHATATTHADALMLYERARALRETPLPTRLDAPHNPSWPAPRLSSRLRLTAPTLGRDPI